MQAKSKEAKLAGLRESVAAAESAGVSNTAALQAVASQMAELRESYLGWQQTVVANRLDKLRHDSDRIAENDRLKVGPVSLFLSPFLNLNAWSTDRRKNPHQQILAMAISQLSGH